MSKQLKVVEKEQKVFSILQASIDNQRNQAETSQLILNEMLSIRTEVNQKFDLMSEMVQEVRDSVTLINAECDLMQSAVATKSLILTKDRYKEEEDSFPRVVGKYRRMIWSQLKKKFNVPKYNCIRRVDYQGAMSFVSDFRVEDFM